MVNKSELLAKIQEEMNKWLNYYQQIDIHIYSIVTTCFRAGAEFVSDESKKVEKAGIFAAIDNCLATIENDTECLNEIYSIVMNTCADTCTTFLNELVAAGKNDNATLAELKPVEALADIESELIARQRINDESLIALRTLQWVNNIITNEKETE